MKVVTPKQMNQIDSLAIHQTGIPSAVLMENAAIRVVDEIMAALGCLREKRIVLFAGKGNNGGDAFAAARHLYNKNARVDVFIVSDKSKIAGDARINLEILENMGVSTEVITSPSQLEEVSRKLASAGLIVDGILGTGLKGTVEGLIKEIISICNESCKPILSIDIPSGISGETGEVLGICIRASKTVTFALPKTGLLVHPGCDYTGELIVADISIPSKAVDAFTIKNHLIDTEMVSSLFPKRYNNSNKGNYGRVFIISGSTGMTGAGCLSAKAALRTGAGLVYLGVPASLTAIYDSMVTESVTIPLQDNNTGILSSKSIPQILSRMQGMSVAAVGPGLTAGTEIVELVGAVLEQAKIPLVLDADALNAIAKDTTVLKNLNMPAVITPHPGEMARLMGITVAEVQNNRIETSRSFAVQWNIVTVLKGSRTIVACPDGTIYINPTGNSGMSTGGSGDVLTGVIASLIGQGLKVEEAAFCGVYLHGLAGDLAAETRGLHGMVAGDITDTLPYAIKRLMENEASMQSSLRRPVR